MTPRLIVSDLDGTLLGSDHSLHENTVEVLRALVEQGHHVALASGRHYHDMKVFRDQLAIPLHLISTNGAYVHDPEDTLLAANHLAPEHAKTLIGLPRPPQVRLNLYRESGWHIDAEAPYLLSLHATTGFGYQVVPPNQMDTNGVGKVLYLGDPKALKKLEGEAQAAHGDALHITYSTIDSLEIMAGGVNKGVALSSLLERLGLTPAECLAFGDNLNDTEMLDLAGEAQVMSNAHPDLFDRVTGAERIGHHGEAAVAQWLKQRFGL
ncbi:MULTISPECIES: Cof-type HAD-IIB family hydrolase [unclassified Halomonas]|uniref:Cof-type HAD-IIB family hydrolase n=1 Tax=unclassified Halomonas TaxID=2609666 RepID=UPI0007D90AA0|nr:MULTISPECIES: Cof-type HAD-IIB family hydrolase [unclassified Halomonas]MBT2788942.1 Cof-type HAD-IIB family hydrolase [Halomonas sp. ISL-106]MBT2799129.1 Cof-type HAD-IIB family hydrolase [Halomonas sp. ISL-104]OAL60234.1 haloacid dehalogenase [Halomonas sp. ALS9]